MQNPSYLAFDKINFIRRERGNYFQQEINVLCKKNVFERKTGVTRESPPLLGKLTTIIKNQNY